MTKQITKAWIMQQLEDEFALREWEPAPFLFDETVIPVFDIKENIQKPKADYSYMSVTSGPTAYLFFTVPQNQRWHLNRYNVVFMATGAYTVTGVYISRKNQVVPDAFIYLDMTLGQTASYAIDLVKPVRLDSGDRVYVYVDSYTSTADLRLYIDYVAEVLR